MNVAIARAIDAAPSEVEGFKRALALTDEMVPDGLNTDQAKKAREAIRRAIQNFARELVSSLQYYQNQPGSLGIGEIVLTGGTAHLPGISGELERMIGVRVRVGDPLARMKVSKKVGEPEQIGRGFVTYLKAKRHPVRAGNQPYGGGSREVFFEPADNPGRKAQVSIPAPAGIASAAPDSAISEGVASG